MTDLVKRNRFLHPQVEAQAIAAMAKVHRVLTVVVLATRLVIDSNVATAVRV